MHCTHTYASFEIWKRIFRQTYGPHIWIGDNFIQAHLVRKNYCPIYVSSTFTTNEIEVHWCALVCHCSSSLSLSHCLSFVLSIYLYLPLLSLHSNINCIERSKKWARQIESSAMATNRIWDWIENFFFWNHISHFQDACEFRRNIKIKKNLAGELKYGIQTTLLEQIDANSSNIFFSRMLTLWFHFDYHHRRCRSLCVCVCICFSQYVFDVCFFLSLLLLAFIFISQNFLWLKTGSKNAGKRISHIYIYVSCYHKHTCTPTDLWKIQWQYLLALLPSKFWMNLFNCRIAMKDYGAFKQIDHIHWCIPTHVSEIIQLFIVKEPKGIHINMRFYWIGCRTKYDSNQTIGYWNDKLWQRP